MKKDNKEAKKTQEDSLCRCYDCKHWHMIDNGAESGQFDFSSGDCDRNGYSKCPPVFSCKGWEKGNYE